MGLRYVLQLLFGEISVTSEAGEKNKHRFGIIRILEIFYVCLTKFENYHISLHQISHSFLVRANLFNGRKSLIQKGLKANIKLDFKLT